MNIIHLLTKKLKRFLTKTQKRQTLRNVCLCAAATNKANPHAAIAAAAEGKRGRMATSFVGSATEEKWMSVAHGTRERAASPQATSRLRTFMHLPIHGMTAAYYISSTKHAQ